MIIPNQQTRRWRVSNLETRGDIHYTKNMNFDSDGYAALARRSIALLYDTSSLGHILSIGHLGTSDYYLTTSDAQFKVDLSGTTTTLGNFSGSNNSDGAAWQNRWYGTLNDNLGYTTGGSYTTGLFALTGGVPHPLCVFESLNYMAIGNGNTVALINTSHSSQTVLTLPADFTVIWIRYKDSNVYVGTKNNTGGDAKMFVWNGSGTAAQNGWPVGGTWSLSGAVFLSRIVTINSLGQLLEFNGGGFSELANLPVYYTDFEWIGSNGYTNGKVINRGMVADGGVLYLSLDGSLANGDMLPQQPSGLWVFDPNVGLYHKAGYSHTKLETRTISGTDTNTETFTAASYDAITGTPVLYTGSPAATGLVTSTIYYLIRVTATTFKLATTYANAVAGTAINITGAGTSDKIYYHDDFEFGRSAGTSTVNGAIGLLNNADGNISTYKGLTGSQLLYGSRLLNNAATSKFTLQTLSTGFNVGYIVTSKLKTSNIKESWQYLHSKYERLLTAADSILVKYRIIDIPSTYAALASTTTRISWIDGHAFSTQADLTNVSIGDLVEIVDGSGSGNMAHVLDKQQGSSEWIITLDETFNGITTGDIGGAIFRNFTKINTASSTDIDRILKSVPPNANSKWIQFLIEIKGISNPYIEELNLTNAVNKSAQ